MSETFNGPGFSSWQDNTSKQYQEMLIKIKNASQSSNAQNRTCYPPSFIDRPNQNTNLDLPQISTAQYNNSVVPSISGRSGYNSISGLPSSSRVQSSFHTHQPSSLTNQNCKPAEPVRPSSAAGSVFSSSEFKVPQVPKKHTEAEYYKSHMRHLLNECQDKYTLKFATKILWTTLQTCAQQLPLPLEYKTVFNMVGESFISTFGSRVMGNSTYLSSAASECSTVLNFDPPRATSRCMLPQERDHGSNLPFVMESQNEQDLGADLASLFAQNESRMAQRRDQLAACAPTASSKMTTASVLNNGSARRGRPRKAPTLPVEKQNQTSGKEYTFAVQATPMVRQGAKGVTRTGRVIRSPLQFWKGNESKLDSTVTKRTAPNTRKETVDLNESIVLRNNKVLQKSKSPNTVESTPLFTLQENKKLPVTKKGSAKSKEVAKKKSPNTDESVKDRPTPLLIVDDNKKLTANKKGSAKSRPPAKKTGKENIVEKKKTTNKRGSIGSKVNNARDSSSKAEPKTSNKRKSPKKVEKKPVKRKNSDLSESMQENANQKKKKVEDSIHDALADVDSDYSEDDLFGPRSYKKKTVSTFEVLSPNSGMMSAKKAAASILSKETPPCKALTVLMNNITTSACSSAEKEAPMNKPDNVVKRVTKMIKATAANPPKVKKVAKREVKKSPASLEPVIRAFLGKEPSSDEESDDDEFDEDLE